MASESPATVPSNPSSPIGIASPGYEPQAPLVGPVNKQRKRDALVAIAGALGIENLSGTKDQLISLIHTKLEEPTVYRFIQINPLYQGLLQHTAKGSSQGGKNAKKSADKEKEDHKQQTENPEMSRCVFLLFLALATTNTCRLHCQCQQDDEHVECDIRPATSVQESPPTISSISSCQKSGKSRHE
jgi:hypothetical protein